MDGRGWWGSDSRRRTLSNVVQPRVVVPTTRFTRRPRRPERRRRPRIQALAARRLGLRIPSVAINTIDSAAATIGRESGERRSTDWMPSELAASGDRRSVFRERNIAQGDRRSRMED
jgi:hypothetical protein